ncbi:MAG TPA: sugar transferase [Candidatus Binataceae bacterium]|nr:sugar transferase [Candidatus Binataceae bacterium]
MASQLKPRRNSRRALVLGANREAAQRSEFFRSRRRGASEIVGFVSGNGDGRLLLGDDEGEQVCESFESILDGCAIDEVLQIGQCPGLDGSQLPTICAERGITLRTLVRSPLGNAGRYTTECVGNGQYVISFEAVPEARIRLAVKRALDVVGALIGLIGCGVAYLLLARRIKQETEGSVIFRQTRVGRNGRLFKLYKFRTMHITAEERLKELINQNEMRGHVFKLCNDPRITPLGRAMRKRYLDELPQFLNVLKGDMSLVGTRPPTRAEVAKYSPHHQRRLSVKPGMTGFWQLTGNGKVTDFEEIVRLDCRYIDNWSLWLDCKIIGKTFIKLFRGGGW